MSNGKVEADGVAKKAADLPVSSGARPDELLSLARAAAEGDPSASTTLVLQVGGRILSTVRKVLGPGHADVDDVAQEAVLAFLRSLKGFRGECLTLSYAQRIALLTALAARRKLVAQQRLVDQDAEWEGTATGEPGPLAATLAVQRRELLRKVLDRLPDVIAEALSLHFILGYTVDEIAEVTGSPENTIWSRLRLGKQALRRRIRSSPEVEALFLVDE